MPNSKVRLLLSDDHPELLRDIQLLLSAEFDVVGAVADGSSLVKMAEALRPDVVVSDIRMPGLNGIEAARIILGRKHCKAVVILTMYDDSGLIRNAMEAGALAYVLKVNAGEELIPAIEEALHGRKFISHSIDPDDQAPRGV